MYCDSIILSNYCVVICARMRGAIGGLPNTFGQKCAYRGGVAKGGIFSVFLYQFDRYVRTTCLLKSGMYTKRICRLDVSQMSE